MLRSRLVASTTLLAATTLLSGCFNSENSPTGATGDNTIEEQAIESVALEEMASYTDVDVRYYDDSDAPALAPINTHIWRRQVLEIDRSINITIENPSGEPATADVTLEADIRGLLHLLVCSEADLLRLTKDFDDHARRRLFFMRTRERDLRHRGWKLVALSGVEIASSGTTRQINSVRVQAGDVDETITGVTELQRIGDLLTLPAESEVTVTVDTGDATDQVYLHLRHLSRRLELTSNNDGTFTGVYRSGKRAGPCHAVIDVLSNATLFDDEAPYDNVAWGITYRLNRGGTPSDGE